MPARAQPGEQLGRATSIRRLQDDGRAARREPEPLLVGRAAELGRQRGGLLVERRGEVRDRD